MNEKVQLALVTLADKLNTTVEHLWGVLVKQAQIEAVVSLLIWLVFLAISIVLLRIGYGLHKTSKVGNNEAWVAVSIAGLTIFVACIIGFIPLSHRVAGGFLNPEYVALEKVLNMLR